MFSLKSAGKAAHFLGANVLLPVAQAALAVPGAVIQGSATLGSGLDSLAEAAGAAREGVDYMMEESQLVREYREQALPYSTALEEARYEEPLQDDSERPATPRPQTRPRASRAEASSSSSSAAAASNWPPRAPRQRTSNQVGQTSSSTAAATSSREEDDRRGDTKMKAPRITMQDVESVMGRLQAVRDFGFGY
jgi:hypothetical protein